MFVYVLSLSGTRFYIGAVDKLEGLFQRVNKIEWVNKREIIDLIDLFPTENVNVLDFMFLEYVNRYGLDAVRAGVVVAENLSIDVRCEILSMAARFCVCFVCHSPRHRVIDCPHRSRPSSDEKYCLRCEKFGHKTVSCPKLVVVRR